MKLIDSHHHIWIPEQRSPDLGYAWLRDIGAMKPFGDPTPIQRDYEWAEFSAESAQHELCGSVYLQVDAGIRDPIAETQWAQSAIQLPASCFALVGFADLSSNRAQEQIEQQTQNTSFKGVRQIVSFLDDNKSLCFASEHLLRNARWRDQFALLSDHSLRFDLQLYPEQMTEAAEFLSHHPNIPVVIDHAGSPYDQSEAGLAKLNDGLSAIGQLPQVQFKLSGFGMFDRQWNSTSIQPIIELAFKHFGSNRIMFGSNFPVDKLMKTYDDCVNQVLGCVKQEGEEAIEHVFFNNANRFYDLSS